MTDTDQEHDVPSTGGPDAAPIGQRVSDDPPAQGPDETLARGEAAASEIDGWTDLPGGHREGPPADDDAVREKGDSTQG